MRRKMPFDDEIFNGVFINSSLHERSQPARIFEEINRCLKPGGKYLISDAPCHESVCEMVSKVND